MPSPYDALARLGLTLPTPPAPVAAYTRAVAHGGVITVSGQLPMRDGALAVIGRVPDQVDEPSAAQAAQLSALNALAVLHAELGDLGRIARVLRLGVIDASDHGYGGQPKVANGASELIAEVLGPRGVHPRAAVGCSALPLNAPVEVELTAAYE